MLFILALIPQFVDPRLGHVFLQFIIFGSILNLGGTLINALVGVFAGRQVRRLKSSRNLSQFIQWITSFLFVGLAIRLAFNKNDYSIT